MANAYDQLRYGTGLRQGGTYTSRFAPQSRTGWSTTSYNPSELAKAGLLDALSENLGGFFSAAGQSGSVGGAGSSFRAPANVNAGGNRFAAGLTGTEQRLSALLDDPSKVQQTASYKFRLGQGEQALQRQMAAKGMLGSGNRLMELTKYGQDMASQEYEAQTARLANLLGTYSGAYNTAEGQNLNALVTQRGQDITGATAWRGQDLEASTAARGQTLNFLGNTLQSVLGWR